MQKIGLLSCFVWLVTFSVLFCLHCAGAETETSVRGETDATKSIPSSTEAGFEQQSKLTLQQQMELAINESLSQPLCPNPGAVGDLEKSQLAAIKSEMAIFESSGIRGRGLQLVHSYLLSIPPSSVEAERAFSAAGVLCTKVRSRLSDKSLDMLCFLRSYYTQLKTQLKKKQ